MNEIETSYHLYQRPMYQNSKGSWSYDFIESLQNCPEVVHLDIAAVVSFLAFGMVGLDRTLIREITRRPWMSRITADGQVVKEKIPPHGFLTGSDQEIAKHFYRLLCDEARTACVGFSEIYVLLSGGLDSRIIAGVLADLYQHGEIAAKPKAVTWGFSDSRDVVYAKNIAEILDLEWQNIEFGPETILQNIDAAVNHLGLLHSPEYLHNMLWFQTVSKNSLVVAGSFGDSIGRAEFAGLHLLQLQRKSPINSFMLLKPNVYQGASMELNRDLDKLYSRADENAPLFAHNEHWMQGFRMRGGLCHALSIINNYANIYQMFSAPDVYKFMWSLHPARRDNNIYAAMLESEFPKLARIPWPRTNRALKGSTIGAIRNLRPRYHEYTKWSSGPLYSHLLRLVDLDWFDAIGLFNMQSICKVKEMVRGSQERVGLLNEIWLWLAGFRKFVETLEQNGKKLVIQNAFSDTNIHSIKESSIFRQFGAWGASNYQIINSTLKSIRGYYRKRNLKRAKKNILHKYPPVYKSKF